MRKRQKWIVAVSVLLLAAILMASTTINGARTVLGIFDASGATHTLSFKVVANTGALPASGCTAGEMAVVTAASLGQQIYQNSGSGTCVWTQQLNTGSSNGGGITVYSGTGLTLSGTLYFPIGGGATPSSTETNVDVDSPSAATVTNMYIQLSIALGMGNSGVFTFRKNATSQSLTCTISGASSTTCSDTTHSFNVSQGDLLTIQAVFSGTIVATPNVIIAEQFGTSQSGGTVNTGTINQTAYYASAGTALSGVGPGTTGQVYTSNGAGSPPSFQTPASSAFPLTFVQESQQYPAGNVTSFTITFPQTTAASGNTAFMIVGADGSATVNSPAGWTVDLDVPQASFSRFMLLHKATASDTSATFTFSSSTIAIYFFEVTGTHALDQSSTGGQAIAQTVTLPAITPTANSVVFGMAAVTVSTGALQIFPTANPNWSPIMTGQLNVNSARAILGFVSRVAATNVSTRPPQIGFSSALFGSSGIAFATFSIL